MTDVEFFAANPDRQYRVRMAMSDEIAALIAAGLREPHSELYCFAAVRRDGDRLDTVLFNDAKCPTRSLLEGDGLAHFVFESNSIEITPIAPQRILSETHGDAADAPGDA
jgi:hypothetical protein